MKENSKKDTRTDKEKEEENKAEEDEAKATEEAFQKLMLEYMQDVEAEVVGMDDQEKKNDEPGAGTTESDKPKSCRIWNFARALD